MAVKIGHASLDENGRIASGEAGDQNGKEVCTRGWYDKGWDVLLRPKNPIVAEKSAEFVEDICANDCVGYDQNQRNTLYKQAKLVNYNGALIKIVCECDCSSLMHVAAIAGGAVIAYGTNGCTTRTLEKMFVASDEYEALKDKKYLTSDSYLKRGDILVKYGSHTVMALENGDAEKSRKLTVDGDWGCDTTLLSQKVFGTYQDGIISNQPHSCKKYLLNAYTESWEFKWLNYKEGSDLIRAIQIFLADLGYYTDKIDGLCGRNTIIAMQKFLKKNGFYDMEIDGYMGAGTVAGWQMYINSRL